VEVWRKSDRIVIGEREFLFERKPNFDLERYGNDFRTHL
jgi:hypothetical protein